MQNRKEYVDAPFFTRWIAFIIDVIIVNAAIFMGGSAILWLDFMKTQIVFQYTIADVLKYLMVAAYFVAMTYSNGRTLGKMAMGIAVVGKDGEKLSFVNVLFRETIGRFLSGLGNIGYLIALVNNHRALHDLLCDTRVCYYEMWAEKKAPPVWVTEGVQPQMTTVFPQETMEEPVANDEPANDEAINEVAADNQAAEENPAEENLAEESFAEESFADENFAEESFADEEIKNEEV